jgi:thiol-disulfide isomerase/thioredoxin
MRVRVVAVLLLIVALAGAFFAYQHREGLLKRFRHHVLGDHAPPRGVLDVGERLPALQFRALDGSLTSLTPRPGRILFLDVFTTWCPDCVNETPALQQLRKATASKPVDIVGIDQQEDPATINAFISRFGLTYPIVIDEDNITQLTFGVHYIPVAYLVDSTGMVKGHVIGPQSFAEMQRLVDDALHNRAVGFGS